MKENNINIKIKKLKKYFIRDSCKKIINIILKVK